MRILLLLFVLSSVVSCIEDKKTPDNFAGNWTWTHSYSGWGGTQLSSPQFYQELRMHDGEYEWLINDSIEFSGNYYITTKQSIFNGQDELMLNLEGMLESPFIFEKTGNQLILKQNANDGTTFYFTK